MLWLLGFLSRVMEEEEVGVGVCGWLDGDDVLFQLDVLGAHGLHGLLQLGGRPVELVLGLRRRHAPASSKAPPERRRRLMSTARPSPQRQSPPQGRVASTPRVHSATRIASRPPRPAVHRADRRWQEDTRQQTPPPSHRPPSVRAQSTSRSLPQMPQPLRRHHRGAPAGPHSTHRKESAARSSASRSPLPRQ